MVIVPALGTVGLEWAGIQQLLAPSVRTCLYDRGGLGWSEYVPGPRTIVRLADELRDLLVAAEIPPPYVLAGHSVGGVIARDFATRHRDLTGGLVLVDSSHEQMMQRFAALDASEGRPSRRGRVLRRAARRRLTWLGIVRALDVSGLAPRDRTDAEQEFPPDLVDAAMAMDLTSGQRRARIREMLDLQRGFDEAYALRQSLDGLPLTVLTARALRRSPEEQMIWEELQADFVGLANDSVQQFVDSPHHIHLHRPDVVVKAVLATHERAKTSS